VNPEPDEAELGALYDADYSEGHDRTWHGFEDGLNRQVLGLLKRRGVRSLTDLGAGQGRFVFQAGNAGIAATGVEPSSLNGTEARERYGIELHHLTVQQFLAGRPRDLECITMLNVLEHLPRPVAVLEQVAQALRPGGTVAVVVPNVDFTLMLGRVRRLAGFADVYMLDSARFSQQGFDPPIHLSSFNARHLRRAFEAAGLRVERLGQAAVIRSANPLALLAKRAVAAAGRGMELVSGGRIVWGYSLLGVAIRP
jgi:SAM-dependent methyltransferase